MTEWKTHARWEAERGGDAAEAIDCTGVIEIVDRSEPIWTLVCNGCGMDFGLPARMAGPDAELRIRETLIAQRRAECEIPEELRGLTWARVVDCESAVLAAAKQLVDQTNKSHTSRRGSPGQLSADLPARWQQAPPSRARRGLVLSGTVGSGKTTLAAVTAWALLAHQPVRWCYAPNLLGMLSADFGSEEFATASAIVRGTEALVLDDLDKARANESAGRELLNTIDNRVTAGAPIIVTTNITLDEIADRYPFGNAIASRLAGHCRAFRMIGRDRRLVSAA